MVKNFGSFKNYDYLCIVKQKQQFITYQIMENKIITKLEKLLNDNNISFDSCSYNGTYITILIEWGDWKHEHLKLDRFLEKQGYYSLGTHTTEEDGSDTYSAEHAFLPPMEEEIDKETIKETLIKSFDSIDETFNMPNNYSLVSFWEERDNISTNPKDKFLKRENNKEYWLTISLFLDGNVIMDYSPTATDEMNNYQKVIEEIYNTIN